MPSVSENARWLALTFSENGVISSLCAGAEQWTGYPTRDLLGQHITRVLSDRSLSEVPRIMDFVRQRGGWSGKITYRCRSGQSLDAEGSVSSLEGEPEAPAEYILVSRILGHSGSELEPLPPSPAEVAAQLRRLAHEMNNPLAVIMGFAQLIMMNPQCAGRVRVDMEKLYAEIGRVVQCVERLQLYTRSLQERAGPEAFASVAVGVER